MLVGLGHVGRQGRVAAPGGAARVGGHTLAAMERFDGGGADADLDDLVGQRVRDGVIVVLDLDVVVDVHPRLRPRPVDERLGRQRAERRLLEAREELLAAGAVEAHAPGIEIDEQLGDAGVEGGQGEEGLMAEPGQDPPLGYLHGDFDFRFVPSATGARGQDGAADVLSELFIGALHAGLVAARHDDAALELIAHNGGRHATEERQGAGVAGDPVRTPLSARRLGVRVVGGAEDGDEQLDLADFARGGVDKARLLPGVVDEAFLAGAVDLAHRQAASAEPAAIDVAELRVAVAGVGMPLEILEVE